MEKYARQAVTEGVKCAEDLHISGDSELYRVLNLHYNRNNHIEVNISLKKIKMFLLLRNVLLLNCVINFIYFFVS